MVQLATPPASDTPAPLPAPVIPYGDPSTGSIDQSLTLSQQADEAVSAENQAQQITSASLSAYGSLPNPQLAFEAITTGATPTISSMVSAGSPLFQAELAGAPAGSAATGSPYPQVPSKINDPATSLWVAPTAQEQQKTLADSPSWKSFGTAPEMNFAWMQQQSKGTPTQIRNWQNRLYKQGFYAGKYQVSGVWDQATQAAFQSFMIQWATPYALFSNDAVTKSNANEFLNGLGMDTATLETSIGRDPSTLAQIAQGWMAAQGPDADADQKSELQRYSDQFGMAALPDSYQSMLHSDFLTGARNTVAGVLGILNPVPILGGALHVAENVLTGNVGGELAGGEPLGDLTQDPRQLQADQIRREEVQQDKLSAADVANLNPALQQIADDAGFLGFMSTYDNIRTNTILTIWDTLKDFASGHAGKDMNPFDPMSSARIEAASADNNLAVGIFGAGWAADNPGWATLFNVGINIVDDPTSYVSLLGKLDSVQRYKGIQTASKMIGDDKAREAFAAKTAEGMRVGVNQGLFNVARTAYKGEGLYGGLSDVSRMYAITGAGGARDAQAMMLLKKAMEEPDPNKAWDMIQHGDPDDPTSLGFGWKVQAGKGVYHQRAAMKAMSQVKSKAILGKMRTVGGFNTSTRWNALTDPAGTSQFLGNMAVIAEMEPKDVRPLIDAYTDAALTDPDNAVSAANTVRDAVMKHFYDLPEVAKAGGEAAFKKYISDGIDHVVTYAPDEFGDEQSRYILDTGQMTEAQKRNAQDLLNSHMRDLKNLRATGGTPEQIKAIQDELARTSRPGPAYTSQLGNEFEFGASPFEMVVFKNKAFRGSVKLQKRVGLDQVMNTWRRVTIARISSAMRMDLGDDMIRPFTQLMFSGNPVAASQYLTMSIARMFGLLAPKARGAILQGLDKDLEENPELFRLMQTKEKILQEGETNSHIAVSPGEAGYAQALSEQIRNHWRNDPISKAWLKAYADSEKESARVVAAGPEADYQVPEGDRLSHEDAARQAVKDLFETATKTAGRDHPQLSTALGQYRRALKEAKAIGDTGDVSPALMRSEALKAYKAAVSGGEFGKIHPDAADDLVKVAAYVRGRNGHLSPQLMDQLVDQWHSMMSGYMSNPEVREMATNGVNIKKLQKLVRDQAGTPHRLPPVLKRVSSPYNEANFTRLVNKMPDAVFENITGPAINSARGQGFKYLKKNFEDTIRDYFKGQPRFGTPEFEKAVDQESTAQAIDWLINNTYQGTRSVMGATMRNIFPFYGATANMDKFFLRQSMAHPFVGSIVSHVATASSQSSNPSQVNSPGMTGLQGILSHLGFGAGEGVQFNPLHAFFLTSDGIGSMVPGTGPIFAPLWNLASVVGNGNFAQELADIIPGAAEQIDFNTGQAKPQFPWLADLLEGLIMQTGAEVSIPLLGDSQAALDSRVNAKIQQEERAHQGTGPQGTVTGDDKSAAVREVGRDLMLQGVASYTAPVDPVVEDVQSQDTAQNLDLWRQQTTDAARDQVMLQFMPGVKEPEWQAALAQAPGAPTVAQLIAKVGGTDAAVMAYEDSRVSQADRDAIANAEPWVVSATQSKYQTANLGPDQPDRPFDLPQWQLMRSQGDITTLSPDAFMGSVANERDINTGWLEYDNLKDTEYQAMINNGWTTSSPGYTAWNASVFQPQLIAIQGRHPAWWTQFGSGGSGQTAADLAGKTRALRTLQTWEVLPQHSDFENTQTVLWRNAIQLRDNAAGQIYALKAAGGSTTEQQLVMASLQQQLENLAAQDPTFAAMLGGFRYASWEDVVNLEADEMQANAYAGYPAQPGIQGQG